MVSFTTATARSPAPSSPSKKIYNGGHINDALSSPGTTWQRGGPTQSDTHKAKNGKHKRQTSLLDRLSLPCAPLSPSGTLLERIGGSVQDEAVSEGVDGDRVSTGAGVVTHSPFSTLPHYYTPEPDEVERFLQSVIGAPPPPPSPSSPHACLGTKPTLVLDTDNLPVKLVDESSSSVLYSPTQTAVNSLPSAHLALDPCQHSPLLGDTAMPPLSATALEECRTHLVPVLVASAHARDPGTRLDADQCHKLLTDDHCNRLFRQAEKMRQQLASRVSHKIQTPADQGWRGSLKRDRVEDVDTWVRRTRSRFDSVYSDMSRRDSDITLVDFPGGRLPPKAPRAMLKASQAFLTKSLDDAPYEGLVASPIAEDHPTSLSEQAIRMFPVLGPPAVAEPVGMSTGDPSATNFVSHLPTQPGIWFKQQGRDHAEIVDVDIDVTEDMFYMSRERLRMHLRLCSVPVDAIARGDIPALLQDVDRAIEDHALHWPKKGTLVVQVNPESEHSQTWLPYTLESDPLDVTSCMRPGRNTFRFIQLSDLSEFRFVLVASTPPPQEVWRSWDWASLSRSTRPTDESMPMTGLSEFACLPVTVRS